MKVVFFDASGVLYYRPDKYRLVRDFLRRHNLPVPEARSVRRSTRDIHEHASTGAVSLETYRDALLAAWGAAAPELRAEGQQVLAAAEHDVCLYEGVANTAKGLRKRGFKLGVVTDTVVSTPDALRRLINCGLDMEWDAFANSVDIGMRKPDPRPYLAALEQCGVTASKTVYVGHNQDELDMAHRLGMTTVAAQYRSAGRADHHIHRFADLLQLPFLHRPE
jgi:HAD superfamily hydrolase (TIGR01509 family)